MGARLAVCEEEVRTFHPHPDATRGVSGRDIRTRRPRREADADCLLFSLYYIYME
jgi:hypothetical protein